MADTHLNTQIEKILDNGVLVDLNIGFWQGLQRNTKDDLGISEEPEYVAGLGTKRLVSKEIRDEWRKIVAQARYVIRKHSFVFPIGESAFVPIGKLPDVETELLKLQQQFEAAREKLAKDFDALRADAIKAYRKANPENANVFEQNYPAKDEAVSAFYFRWAVFNVALPKKMQLRAFNKKKAQKDAEILQQYQHRLEEQMQGFIADAVQTLRARAIDFCSTIRDKIKSGDVVSTQSLNALRTWIDRFHEMNFAGDAKVADALTRLKRDVLIEDRDGATFHENKDLTSALDGALKEVQKAAESVTDLEAITGGYKRKIRV